MAKAKSVQFETMSNSYKTTRLLGQGGAGTVYEVVDQDSQTFALKVLSGNSVSTEKTKRFKNEMSFLLKNRHPNIVPVLDTGFIQTENKKSPFYVMPQYGGTLRTLITKGITQGQVLRYFGEILDGVEALHLQNVWHRDLKPENILHDEQEDRVLVADLGVAHFEEENLYTSIETQAATRLANFQYAAPEQRRKGAGVNHKADIYALGLMLNEMFTGDVLQGAGHKTIATVAPNYAYLDDLVNLMVQQSPENRPNSTDSIKQELIGRMNGFIQRQKISQLEKTVIPVSELDDVLIDDPVRILAADYENGNLHFTLNHVVTSDWIYDFQNPKSGYTHTHDCAPNRFNIHGTTATIRANEHNAVSIANYFKQYLANANEQYKRRKTTEHSQKQQQERQALQASIERAKKEAEVRESILSRISF